MKRKDLIAMVIMLAAAALVAHAVTRVILT
jgi:hypothetical protein